MIHHKVEDNYRPKYVEEVEINKNLFHRIKRCLDEESLEEMSDAELENWHYKKDSCELMFDVGFEDGASLTWKLCSGTHNYYDDVTFWFGDGRFVDLDCTYELDDIEVETDRAVYVVKLVIK